MSLVDVDFLKSRMMCAIVLVILLTVEMVRFLSSSGNGLRLSTTCSCVFVDLKMSIGR